MLFPRRSVRMSGSSVACFLLPRRVAWDWVAAWIWRDGRGFNGRGLFPRSSKEEPSRPPRGTFRLRSGRGETIAAGISPCPDRARAGDADPVSPLDVTPCSQPWKPFRAAGGPQPVQTGPVMPGPRCLVLPLVTPSLVTPSLVTPSLVTSARGAHHRGRPRRQPGHPKRRGMKPPRPRFGRRSRQGCGSKRAGPNERGSACGSNEPR